MVVVVLECGIRVEEGKREVRGNDDKKVRKLG